jgi:excinuclease ABC subunit A
VGKAERTTTDGQPAVIRLRGVRTHNLKGIDVEIPRNHITVVSGVSGSGKSSLAFDTLYAEGRRRYVECLSTYLQQFMERMARPDVDAVEAVPPAVAIQRAVPAAQARSTVGTLTEIHDYLRILWARLGRTFCVECYREVTVESVGDVVDAVLNVGGRGIVTFEADAPGSRPKWKALIEELGRDGFARIWQRDKAVRLEKALYRKGPVEVVVDRVPLEEARRARIAEATETAYRFGHDRCTVRFEDGTLRRFSRRLHCPDCDRVYRAPEPKMFSPNSPLGACPECQGFGRSVGPDMARIVPDPGLSLAEGAIDPWNKPAYRRAYDKLRHVGREIGLDWNVPYRDLPAEHRDLIENGGPGFRGLRGFFRWLERKTYKVHVRVFLARYRGYSPCPACDGKKLRPESLAVRVGGKHLAELTALPVEAILSWIDRLDPRGSDREVAAPVVQEVRRRLHFLYEVGLGYLTLDRPSRTLSGGEAQRIQMARSLGSGLVDTLYVLDEPSVGLHPRDVDRLIDVMKRLRDMGNTLVVVEHDVRVIENADWLIDLGPGAGEAGGEVTYRGPVVGVERAKDSVTGRWLAAGDAGLAVARHEPPGGEGWIELEGASIHNLRDVSVRFPRQALTVVTGVSGSGKSSLIHDTLYGALAGNRPGTGPFRALRGADVFAGVEMVDQSPIGKTPRSNPVTYVKAFDGIRKRLAATPAALARGLKPGYFSFNVPGGRCEKCEGAGSVLMEMHFLPDMYVPCDACEGRRFGPGALDVRYRGMSVADILDLTVERAIREFQDAREVAGRLEVLDEIGLGYLRLGQPATTLSGGEAQRLKLASHLYRRDRRPRVLLLDEPTTGLHMQDVAVLVGLLGRLVEAGNTVVVIEHHLAVVGAADWVVDLGPGAGEEGGRLVAQGTPEEVARSGGETGRYLTGVLCASSS